MHWLNLTLSLPAGAATVRMRVWRTIKACGAAVLRDGVYLLPDGEANRATFAAVAQEVRSHDGTAYLLEVAGDDSAEFEALFDRSEAYREFISSLKTCRGELYRLAEADANKLLRKQRKSLDQITAIDFFPGASRAQAKQALLQLEAEQVRRFSPDEPRAGKQNFSKRDPGKFQRKTWATRRRPKIDRLASAWLIRRHIDPEARFVWLKKPADCPARAIGFDFDGAAFTHTGDSVTFETLLASFNLRQPALQQLAAVVHALDVGGPRPPEADGLECILDGYGASIDDDDALLNAVLPVFDSLIASFSGGKS